MANQNPTDTEHPTRPSTAGRPTGGRRRVVAGATGALLLAAGLGGAALAQSPTGDGVARTPQATDSVGLREGRTSSDLGDLTLDELADELERLGLEVRVTPESDAGDAAPDHDASGDQEGSGAVDVDPFDGLTDAEIDALSDEEFFERLEAAGIEPEWVDEDDDGDGAYDDDDGQDEAPLGTASIDGDRIDTTGLRLDVAEPATTIWERFAQLVPADQRQMISGFELLGEDYQGAHVYPDDDDPTRWILGVGVGLGDDLDDVLVHEFGHLLTLQAEEVPPGDDGGSCPTYHTGEGCALRGSTMADFVQRFWPQEMRDRVEELYQSDDEEAFEAFYQDRQDQFVTDYAASNPAEDLAETFAVFVTEDRPTGDTIADQKVELLWSDPAMVDLRTTIRAAL